MLKNGPTNMEIFGGLLETLGNLQKFREIIHNVFSRKNVSEIDGQVCLQTLTEMMKIDLLKIKALIKVGIIQMLFLLEKVA